MNPEPTNNQTARTYEGGAFHPDFPKGRGSGVITVGSRSIFFNGAKGEFELPFDGLSITLGGASDRLVYFKHASQPDVSAYTADHDILKEQALLAHPELLSHVSQVQGKKWNNRAILLTICLILAAIVGGLYSARDPMVNAVVDRIPVEWESKLGDQVFSAIQKQSPLVEDPELDHDLAMITDPLLKGIGEQKYPFKFHIVENSTVNAFALPGGHVVIYSELLLAADTPEEVAGVLAHEIAHVTHRHSMRNMVKSAGMYYLFQFFLGDVSDLVGVLTRNARYLLSQKFSRDYERDADLTGWNYLVKAQIDPHGMINFFEKLKKKEDENPVAAVQQSLSILNTHPATSERIERLQGLATALPKNERFERIDLNYGDFKNKLRTKLKQETK